MIRERDKERIETRWEGQEREWGDRERKAEAGRFEKGTRDERMEWYGWTWYDNDDSL